MISIWLAVGARVGSVDKQTEWGSIEEGKAMTWSEIKKAVEEAGVREDEEIRLIQCENGDGDHTFHKMRLGNALKLAENVSAEKAREAAEGCAL
jgi:hypothetical protein